MPPTSVAIVIDGGAPRTSILRVDLTLSALDADEMRFSNDGSTWTDYQPFATSLSDWELTDYGGNENIGIHTIYFEVRDSVNNTVQVSSFIRYQVDKPHIRVGTPVQRTDGSFLVDIPYKGYDNFGNKCDLAVFEYSLTGAFYGEERIMTPKVHDDAHDGVAQLDFSPGGTDHNFVWDALPDIGTGEVSNITQIRMRPVFGSDLGEYAIGGMFTVDTRVLVTTGGTTASRGETTVLQIVFTDKNGLPLDPESVDLVSLKDPSGTEHLDAPIPATQSYTGEWYVEWEVATDAELGKWIAIWGYEMDYTPATQQVYLTIGPKVTPFIPIGSETCAVHGQLVYADEKPIANAEVQFIPHHLSDPELGNPTLIGVDPISTTTDDTGKFVVELIRNVELIIFIPSLNFRQFAKVPDEPTSEFRAMMTLLPVGPRDRFGNRTS